MGKKLFDLSTINIKSKHCIKTDSYLVYAPFGLDAECQTVGFDIGTIHLGITGMYQDMDGRKIVTFMALLSFRAKTVPESCKEFSRILLTDNNFGWFRESQKVRIELQRTINQITAMCIQTLAYSQMTYMGQIPDVSYVHGDNKYKIVPLYSTETPQEELRNKPKKTAKERKKLGELDAFYLLEKDNQSHAIKFLKVLGTNVDQIHDICDSYLVACWEYEEDKYKQSKKKRKSNTQKTSRKKQKTDSLDFFDTPNSNDLDFF